MGEAGVQLDSGAGGLGEVGHHEGGREGEIPNSVDHGKPGEVAIQEEQVRELVIKLLQGLALTHLQH